MSDEKMSREAGRIKTFERLVEIPEDLVEQYERWEDDREYIRTLCNQQDTPDTVVTNYILRAIQASIASARLKDPVPVFKSGGYIPAQDHPDPQVQQQSMEDGNPFNRYPVGWDTYVKTQQILITRQAERGGLKAALDDLDFESRFTPVAWMKARWIQDDEADPLGYPLPTEQAKLRRYLALYDAFEDGLFTEEDGDYHELKQLSDDLKGQAAQELRESMLTTPPETPTDLLGLEIEGAEDPRIEELRDLEEGGALFDPDEVLLAPSYQGFEFEVVPTEDVRFEWSVTRPSDLRRMRWIAHRTWMLPADIVERWGRGWDEDDKAAMLGTGGDADHGDGRGTPTATSKYLDSDDVEKDPGEDPEESRRGARRAVWEFYDLAERRRYRWVQGGTRFLDDADLRDAPRRLHPFFPLIGNTTPGTLFGVTDVQLARPAQEWINLLQTHDRQAKRAAYPRWLYENNLFDPADVARLNQSEPYSWTPTKKSIDDIRKSVFEMPRSYDPLLHNTADAMSALETSMGIAASRMGASTAGAKHATTEAVANQGFGDRVAQLREAKLAMLAELFEYMAQMNALRLSGENVQALVGPGAFWPVEQMTHSEILSNFMVRVTASPSAEEEKSRRIQQLTDLAGLMQTAQIPISRIWFVQQVAEAMGAADDAERMIDLNMLLAPPPAPAAPAPGGSKAAPEDQGGEGAGGGRPPMSEQQPPIEPSTIPNNQTPPQ